jgi:aminocarboxymuconate-semialdehyde decarboxylase
MKPAAEPESSAPALLNDHHAHWFPAPMLSLLALRDEPPFARRGDAGWSFTSVRRPRSLTPLALDLRVRQALLSSVGIGRQTLSLSTLWNIDSLPLDAALPLLRAFNDATAAATADSSMYSGLAAVPTRDVHVACEELTRAADLGLGGVVLSAGQLAARSQADRWAPLFAIADARRLRIFIHPSHETGATEVQAPSDELPWSRLLGLGPQHQIGIAMLTLCDSGWLAAFPDVVVQFANLGGSYTFACERLERMRENSSAQEGLRGKALTRVVVDSASLGPEAIRCARGLLGPSTVVFGTDMPIFDVTTAASDWRIAVPQRLTPTHGHAGLAS